MSEFDGLNPYPDDEPKLRRAWEDGYQARERGKRPKRTPDNPSDQAAAWLKGYNTAKLRGVE